MSYTIDLSQLPDEELQERVDIIKHKLKFVEQRPHVACVTSVLPLIVDGSENFELLKIAGGYPVSPVMTFEQLEAADPDIIIVAIPGFSVEDTLKGVAQLINSAGWNELKALQNNQLYLLDGRRYHHTTPEGIVNTVEALAEIVQPKQFIFGKEGDYWIKFAVN